LSQTLDGSSSEDNPTGIAHLAQHHTEDQRLPELLRTETPESQSMNSDHGQLHLGYLNTREFTNGDTVVDTRNLPSTTELLNHVVNGYNQLTKKLNGSCTD